MTDQNIINWDQDADGIVVLTINDPNQGANTMNDAYIASMKATVDRLVAEKDSITGAVITSGKKTFFAGGDLKNMIKVGPEQAEEIYNHSVEIKADLRLSKLSQAGRRRHQRRGARRRSRDRSRDPPRIAADVKGVKIGLPEVTLGLLPGGGGVVRTVRMLGLQNALMGVLLQGQQRGPVQAKEVGLIDEVVGSVEELVPAAKAWIKANPEGGVQRGMSRATRSLAELRPLRHSLPTFRRSPRTCVSSSRALRCRLRAPSWPQPSRVRRSTSTTRCSSRLATSPRW